MDPCSVGLKKWLNVKVKPITYDENVYARLLASLLQKKEAFIDRLAPVIAGPGPV